MKQNQSMVSYRTEILTAEISELYPADWNYKTDDVPEHIKTKFRNSILRDGSAGVLAVREVKGRDGYEVMDGNHRLDILGELKTTAIPLENFGYISEAEAITIAARRNHEWYPADPLLWADVLSNKVLTEFSLEDLDEFMPQTRDILEEAADLFDSGYVERDDDFDVDAALEVEPVSKPGDLWHLGEHRLLCGDSTVKEDVERVMDGEKAALLATDPPYGVDFYGQKYNPRAKAWEGIVGDKRQGPELQDWLTQGIVQWIPVMLDDAVYYFWTAAKQEAWSLLAAAAAAAGLHIQSQIVWVKNQFVLGQADYHWQHENCWYCYLKNGTKHRWFGGRTQSSVWEVKRVASSLYQHPNQKPIELFTIPLANHTRKGEILLDVFNGSGTTLIACEQLSRRCFAIEISPEYIDVAVRRYVQYVGTSDGVFCERDGTRISYDEMFGDAE